MGLPQINIIFERLALTAIQRSQKGVVGVIIRDAEELGEHVLTRATEVPAALSLQNRAYLQRTFLGYVNPPRKVIVYVMNQDTETIEDALTFFQLQQFDYLAGPPDLSDQEAQMIASWVKSERLDKHMVKAVLPNIAADSEAVVNLTTGGIVSNGQTYTQAEYCSRIAGLIAGTPMTISCTYAPLMEVVDVERMTNEQLDAAIDRGEFVLFHDGEKVKVGRGVTSLISTNAENPDPFKKIKIVEAADMIRNDIRKTAQDSYIGKYPNNYDNKCLLIMAIKGYFEGLERSSILERGTSVVEIDLEAQEEYIRQQGTVTTDWTEYQIKIANTGSLVFIRAQINILDAIEDIDIKIEI